MDARQHPRLTGWDKVVRVSRRTTAPSPPPAPDDNRLAAALRGGEIAALALIDACVRLLPGVMGREASGTEESFTAGLLEYPQYTRPQTFEGEPIPEVLLSGDHARIAAWRREQAEALTRARRPDLWAGRPGPAKAK